VTAYLRCSAQSEAGLAAIALEVLRTPARSVAVSSVARCLERGGALTLGVATIPAMSLRLEIDVCARMTAGLDHWSMPPDDGSPSPLG
jgi:hypothetical protein